MRHIFIARMPWDHGCLEHRWTVWNGITSKFTLTRYEIINNSLVWLSLGQTRCKKFWIHNGFCQIMGTALLLNFTYSRKLIAFVHEVISKQTKINLFPPWIEQFILSTKPFRKDSIVMQFSHVSDANQKMKICAGLLGSNYVAQKNVKWFFTTKY